MTQRPGGAPVRAVFFGTPAFAVPCLDALANVAEVVAVVCQPDRPSGRGHKMRPPPVKERAVALGIDVLQPTKVRTAAWADTVRELSVDVGLVVAYGRILTPEVLDAPRLGCVNVHASLLPRWRGAAPIQRAVAAGDRETGVCLMQMDEGLDTGPVLTCRRTAIGPDESAATLSDRLSVMGAELVREELPGYLRGSLTAVPQDEAAATLAPLLKKEDGTLDFSEPARAVHDRVRGMTPWPGAHVRVDDERIKVHASRVVADAVAHGTPGRVLRTDANGIEVACGQGSVRLLELQPEGKRRMSAQDFLAGRRWSVGKELA